MLKRRNNYLNHLVLTHKRIIAASKKGISYLEISNNLRELGFNRPQKGLIPTLVIKILGIFNKDMKSKSTMINRGCYGADKSETISNFDWQPIP